MFLLKIGSPKVERTSDDLLSLELRFPDQTFEGKLVLHGARRMAELNTQGKGHTDSDCYLVLPVDKVAFIGDLGFFASQPFMVDCDPQAWITQLDGMEQWDVETFVPGHGPLGAKADLALQKQYIQVLDELVTRVIKAGGAVEDALQQPLPAPFDAWLRGGVNRFEANVRSSYKRLSGQ
jgi:cyclase